MIRNSGLRIIISTDFLRSISTTYLRTPIRRYFLKLPAGQQYYLIARQSIRGGRPVPGSSIGTYGKISPVKETGEDGIGAPAGVAGKGGSGEAIGVTGKPGEVIQNINIQMFSIPRPEANREKFQKEGKKKSSKPIQVNGN